MIESKKHWENVYTTKPVNSVSWYQDHAECSMSLIRNTGISKSASIIDVGGGASKLVDDLMADGYSNITVLDLSAAALSSTRQRLGSLAAKVHWLETDVTKAELPSHSYDLWHDRAVFHFLTEPQQRKAYIDNVFHSVKPGGHVIVATFAEDGPTQCSGLPVVRYSADGLHSQFGEAFRLVSHVNEAHQTPSGAVQKFVYCYCRVVGS